MISVSLKIHDVTNSTMRVLEKMFVDGHMDLYDSLCETFDGNSDSVLVDPVILYSGPFLEFIRAVCGGNTSVEITLLGQRGESYTYEIANKTDDTVRSLISDVIRDAETYNAVAISCTIIQPNHNAEKSAGQVSNIVSALNTSAGTPEKISNILPIEEVKNVEMAKTSKSLGADLTRKQLHTENLSFTPPDFAVCTDPPAVPSAKTKSSRTGPTAMDSILANIPGHVRAALETGAPAAVSTAEVPVAPAATTPATRPMPATPFNKSLKHRCLRGASRATEALIDYLYPVTAADVRAPKVKELMAAAVRERLFEDPVTMYSEDTGKIVKSLLDADCEYRVRIVQAPYSSSTSEKLRIRTNVEESGNGKVTFSLFPDSVEALPTSVRDGFKTIVETVVSNFINDLADPEKVLQTLVSVAALVNVDDNAGLVSISDKIIESRGVLTSAGVSEFLGSVNLSRGMRRTLDEMYTQLSTENTAKMVSTYIRTSYHTIGGIESNSADKYALAAFEFAMELCQDVWARISPAMDAFMHKFITNSLAADIIGNLSGNGLTSVAKKSIQKVDYVHNLSPQSPHLVIRLKSGATTATFAVPVLSIKEDLTEKVLIDILRSRAADMPPILRESIGVLAPDKELFVLADNHMLLNFNRLKTKMSRDVRAALEAEYELAISHLERNYYVVAFRRPLVAEELLTNRNTTRPNYQGDPIPDGNTRYHRKQYVELTPPPATPTNGELLAKISAINAKIALGKLNFTVPTDHNVSRRATGVRIYKDDVVFPEDMLLGHTYCHSVNPVYAFIDRVAVSGQIPVVNQGYPQEHGYNFGHKIISSPDFQLVISRWKLNPNFRMTLTKPIMSNGRCVIGAVPDQGEVSMALAGQHQTTITDWSDLDTVSNIRADMTRTPAQDKRYCVLACTPDSSHRMYFDFSFYYKDKMVFETHMIRALLHLRSVADWTAVEAAATAPTANCNDFIPTEYSNLYRGQRMKALQEEEKLKLEELRRFREEYTSRFRRMVPNIRRTRRELATIKSSATATLPEEQQLQSLIQRGELEGFRVKGGVIMVKTPELSIYYKDLIHKIGKFVICINGFISGGFKTELFNISNPQTTPRVDHRIQDHPHVRGGTACWGNLSGMLNQALEDQDLITMIALYKSYLSTVNADDAYGRSIVHWPWVPPTLHNIIKFGVEGRISKNHGIVLDGKLKQFKDVSYSAIKAEYDKCREKVNDCSFRGTDLPFSGLPNDLISALLLRNPTVVVAETGPKVDTVATDRTEVQIRQSISRFEAMIASVESWNTYGREQDKLVSEELQTLGILAGIVG